MYSGVISLVDSMSSPDWIIWSNSAWVGMNSFSNKPGGRIVVFPRQPFLPRRGGYSSAWQSTRLWIWVSRVQVPLATLLCISHDSDSLQPPTLDVDGDEVRKGENPTVLLERRLHAAFGRVTDAVGHTMLEDDVGHPGIGVGCHRRVVIAPQEPGFGVEPESLDAAVDGQVGSIVGLQHAVTELCPLDVGSHELVRERVVAPKGVAQEVQKIQSVQFGCDAGVLEMLPSVGSLLEDPATRRQDHHAETVENTDITGFVHRCDDGAGALNINGDPRVRRDVDALELKQESPHGHGAIHRGRSSPDRFSAVGLQCPSRSWGESALRRKFRAVR